MIPTLDELLPNYHYGARHQRCVAAPPDAVWDALQRLTLADMPLGRALVGLRDLPARLAGHGSEAFRPGPIVASPPFPIVASEPGRGLVTAGVGHPWRLLGDGPSRPRLGRGGFVAFDEPGWVKVVVDFRFEPHDHGTLASTETRILATDRRARLAFGVYWQAIRMPSGLIRREMLRATAGLST